MNWRETILGNEIDFFNGKSIKPGQIGQYPAYGSNGIIGGSDEWKYENAIIIGRVGAYCGSVAYCPRKFWASDNTIVSKPKNHFSSVIFYYYLLHHLELNKYAGGAAQPLVTQTVLKQVSVRIPDVETQRRIASILSAYDDLIENNTRRIAILEEMARRIYEEWFVKFKFPGHEKVKMVDSELGKIPEGWEVKTVDETFEILGGGTPSKKEASYWDDGTINWYSPTDLTRSGRTFMESSAEKITGLGLAKSAAKLFPPFSIMMTSRATIGVIAINTNAASTNQGFITCIPNDKFPIYLLFHWLKQNVSIFESLGTGATFKEIIKGVFRQIKLPIPSEKIVDMFQQTVSPMMEQILCFERKNANLRTTRDFLLPKLISGEIDVSKLPEPEEAAA